MPTARLILAALLLTAPLVAAQQAQPGNAEFKTAPTHNAANARRLPRPAFEPLQLTITFKRIHHDKVTTQKTYTVAASWQQADPQIRDDSRMPVQRESSASPSPNEYINGNTDVDIQNIRKAGNLISLTLHISQEGTSNSPTKELPDSKAVLTTHQYTVSPTVPIGRLITVYSQADDINDYKVEIQLLIKPLNEK